MRIRNATRTAAVAVMAVLLLGGAQECEASSGSDGSTARDGGRTTKANLACSAFSGKLRANANGSSYPPNAAVRVDFDIEGPGNFAVSENNVPGRTNGAGSWSTSDQIWTIPENGGGIYTLTITAYMKGKHMGTDTDTCKP